jgi:hypothetical protein
MTEPGYTILDASSENCNNSTWTDLLANCEDCANTFNILRYYGDQVEAAAEDCGLTATFSPSAGASSEAEASSTVSSTTYYSDTVTVATKTTSQVEASTPVAAAATSTGYTAVASGTGLPSPSLNGTSRRSLLAQVSCLEATLGLLYLQPVLSCNACYNKHTRSRSRR